MNCEQEQCLNWTGQGCVCEVLDLAPEPVTDDDGRDVGYGVRGYGRYPSDDVVNEL